MRIFCNVLLLICLSVSATAQHKSLRIDINETFAHYQNAFNNTTHAYKNLVQGYKKSSTAMHVHAYFQAAQKYARSAKVYVDRAVVSMDQLKTTATGLECKHGSRHIQEAKQNFLDTNAKLDSALESLTAGLETSEVSLLGDHLQGAVQSLQSGVLKLNLAIDEVNNATAQMASCK